MSYTVSKLGNGFYFDNKNPLPDLYREAARLMLAVMPSGFYCLIVDENNDVTIDPQGLPAY